MFYVLLSGFVFDESCRAGLLRLCGLAFCVSIGECDVLLLLREEMDEAGVNLKKESKGICMS